MSRQLQYEIPGEEAQIVRLERVASSLDRLMRGHYDERDERAYRNGLDLIEDQQRRVADDAPHDDDELSDCYLAGFVLLMQMGVRTTEDPSVELGRLSERLSDAIVASINNPDGTRREKPLPDPALSDLREIFTRAAHSARVAFTHRDPAIHHP